MKSKKILALLMAIFMVMSIGFTGCSNSATSDSTTSDSAAAATGSSSATNIATAGDRVKIGVAIWGTTDTLGSEIKKYTDYLSKNFNADFVYADSITPEAQIDAVENLVASGCNAVMICNYSDSTLRQIAQTCEQNKVYFSLIFRQIADPEIKKVCEASPYFVGNAVEDDYQAGYNMAKALYQQGSKNMIIVSPMSPGDSCHDNRYNGAMKAFEELGINKVGEFRNSSGAPEAIENFVASLPNLDGIVLTGGVNGTIEACIQTIESKGKTGKIRVATVDIFKGAEEAFKNNAIHSLAGGQFPDPAFVFSMVYGKLTNHPLTKESGSLKLNFIQINSAEDYANYIKYCDGDIPPYTADEIKQWMPEFNEAATLESVQALAKNYSIDDVVKRHKDLIK